MDLQARLLQVATVALYLGPVLAGLSGFGWEMLGPFLFVYLLWAMMLRPDQWPQAISEWLRSKAWFSASRQIVSQLLLIAFLFAIGRGAAEVFGVAMPQEPMLPVAVSFIALPIWRLFWDMEKALTKDLTIDELTYPRQRPERNLASVPRISPEKAISPLLALPGNAPMRRVEAILEEVLDDAEAWLRLEALDAALETVPGKHNALREAVIIWATNPNQIAIMSAPCALKMAFRIAGHDTRLLSQLLPRVKALARSLPQRHVEFSEEAAFQSLQTVGPNGKFTRDIDALVGAIDEVARPPQVRVKRSARRKDAASRMA